MMSYLLLLKNVMQGNESDYFTPFLGKVIMITSNFTMPAAVNTQQKLIFRFV